MATATPTQHHERFVFYDIGWDGYQAMLKLLGGRKVRTTYDRGSMELMVPLWSHERFGNLIGRMVEAITEELDIPMAAAGKTTFNRKILDRGLEPDECYYFASAERLVDPRNIDLDRDPPPDLAIEIEVTKTMLDRIGVYAALGIPEIWRFNGNRLTVLLLQPDGTYAASPSSAVLPFLPMEEIARFAGDHVSNNDTQWARAFRRWVREELVPRYRRWLADQHRGA